MTSRTDNPRVAIQQAIREIAADNTSGAAEILPRAAQVFALLNCCGSTPELANLEHAQQAVIETSIGIALAQPHMSPLLKLASAAISASRDASAIAECFQAVQTAALNFVECAQRGARASASHAASLIQDGSVVLTHSRSSTVLAALIEARHNAKDFSVIATESRPMLEGRTLADALSKKDIRVTLIIDAAAALALDRVDIVLIGADRLTPANLVNKIGTRMIVLAARERGLPVYAICDTSKFISDDYYGAAKAHQDDAREVWPDAPEGVTIVNEYFEPTTLLGFTGIVSEHGTLAIEDAAHRAAQLSIDSALVNAMGLDSDRLK